MSNFIEQIAKFVVKYAHSYGIAVHSPIIAQAILESASGTSELAVNAHNYFGLKYRKGRCKTCIGVYTKVGSEQNKDGSYTSSTMQWCKFSNMENGVIGYFDFINIANYSNLKGVTDPETYLRNIKADGYATSLNYVDNLMAVIKKYNLTKYDKKEETKMSNSPLVSYRKISPHKNSPRNHAIDTITIHCYVGQASVESAGSWFSNPNAKCSCNYVIGSDGRIGLIVDEGDRSWCTSSSSNDNRAVTIECASDKTEPYAVNDKVYASLINLVADICKRNNIKELKWQGNKNLIGQVSKQNMTVHRWFANKSCPGEYLYSRHAQIAAEVNKKLGVSGSSQTSSNTGSTVTKFPATPFSVQVLIPDLNYRSQPSMSGAVKGQTGKGTFTITEVQDGWGKLKSGVGWIWLENPEYCTIKSSVAQAGTGNAAGYKVRINTAVLNVRSGPGTNYGIVTQVKKGEVFTIVGETKNGDTTWGKLMSGAGYISLAYTEKV